MMKKLKLLVTGTGRCGTVYMARLLTSLGIPCGHESIFSYEGLNTARQRLEGTVPISLSKCSTEDTLKKTTIPIWVKINDIVADSSYMAAPYLEDHLLTNVPIIHVVRNPLSVVSSFVKDLGYFAHKTAPAHDRWQQFIYWFIPELKDIDSQVLRGCYYYITWNRFITNSSGTRPFYRHKIESELNADFYKFIQCTPLKQPPFNETNINSFKKRLKDFELSEIPNHPIKNDFIELMYTYKYML